MVIKKFNYYRFLTFIGIVIFIIVITIKLISSYKYKKTYDYKLSTIGYSKEEINFIKEKYNNNQIDKILNIEYDKDIVELLKEKYFLIKNLDKYLEYKKKNKTKSYKDIIAIINTEANVDWMENEKQTDTSLKHLMLVNRLYGLEKSFEVEDIIDVPSKYAYNGVKISNSILDKIIDMINDASNEGYTFVLSDGYRSYEEQEKIYDNYKKAYGQRQADINVARPGHSEYETGISFNIVPYNKIYNSPKESNEYKWLYDNAYKYGFIFRYQEDKKELTGFEEFTWRLRYVGSEASNLIKSENICFEEYYAYFINKE